MSDPTPTDWPRLASFLLHAPDEEKEAHVAHSVGDIECPCRYCTTTGRPWGDQ